jgi:hypothetical protein
MNYRIYLKLEEKLFITVWIFRRAAVEGWYCTRYNLTYLNFTLKRKLKDLEAKTTGTKAVLQERCVFIISHSYKNLKL